MRRHHILSPGEKLYAYDLWMDRYTLQEIAKALYVSVPTLHAAIKEHRYEKPKIAPYGRVKAKYEKLVKEAEKNDETGEKGACKHE